MAPPITAANPARIVRTVVRERVVIPPGVLVLVGVGVTDKSAIAVRVARALAKSVAAPGVGVVAG